MPLLSYDDEIVKMCPNNFSKLIVRADLKSKSLILYDSSNGPNLI